MPVAVAGAAISGALAAGSGATVLGLTGASLGFAVFGANVALSGLSMALQSKPKVPDQPSFAASASNRTLTVRQAITEHRLIVGETRVGGPLVYIGQTDDKKYLHYVVVLAAHEVASIGTVFFDDYPVFVDDLDGDGNVTAGKYADKIRIKKHLGTADQAADADLVAEVGEWTTDHRLRGRAYIYVRYEDDSGTFPGDIPPPSAVVRGAKLLDTRTGTERWTQNAALAARWYQASEYGYQTPAAGFEDIFTDAAANVCDEFVDTLEKAYEVETVDTANDALDLVADDNEILAFRTGDRVAVTSTGTVPGGLTGTLYVIVAREKARDDKTLRIQLAASYADAEAGTAVAVTSAGSETITVTKNGEPRYTCNGTIDAADDPDDVIPQLLSAMGGMAVRSISGTWRLHAAAYTAPTITYDEDDLTGPFTPQIKVSARERFSGVHGIFVSPLTNWQPHDYPAVTSDDYEAEDARVRDAFTADAGTDVLTLAAAGGWFKTGERVRVSSTDTLPAGLAGGTTYRAIKVSDTTLKLAATLDDALAGTAIDITDAGTGAHRIVRLDRVLDEFDLPFTDRSNTAQRLAGIKLRRARQEITVPVKLNLTGFLEQAGGTVAFDYDRLGWSGKAFEVASFRARVENDENGNPAIVTEHTWRETASEAYDFDPATDEVAFTPPVATTLIGAGACTAPTDLTLASGSSVLDTRADGTIFSRIKASWTAPADQYVTSGGRIECQYKKSADADWINAAPLPGDATETFILDVKDGVDHDVRVRAVNTAGVPSAWVAATDHTVLGKTAAPSDVATLTAQQNANVVTFRWTAITDADRAGYELRYMAAPFDWDNATVLSRETKGTLVSNAGLPPGSWTVGIKAIDTSGNYSASATTFAITVASNNGVVATLADEAGRWPGTLAGFVRHDVSGALIPDSNTLAADMSDAELWDQMVFDPVATATYEARAAIDLGFDADGVRVWGDLTARLGPGESGVADPILEIDVRDDAGAYDGFDEWSVGTADFRHLKARAKIATATGVAALTSLSVTCDVATRPEGGEGVTVAPGGTAVTFAERFHLKPNVQVTADDASSPVAARYAVKSGVTVTGFTAHVFDAGGNDVGGSIDWTARGA